jgi:hypothetical protein
LKSDPPPDPITPEYYVWLRAEYIWLDKLDKAYDRAYFYFPDVGKAKTIRFEYMARGLDDEGRIGLLGWIADKMGLIPNEDLPKPQEDTQDGFDPDIQWRDLPEVPEDIAMVQYETVCDLSDAQADCYQ